MQAGLHALTWSLQRLGIAAGIVVALTLFAYVMVIAVIVVSHPSLRLGSSALDGAVKRCPKH